MDDRPLLRLFRDRSVTFTKTLSESRRPEDGARLVNQYVVYPDEIGRGTYGSVHRCEVAGEPGAVFAVKIMSRSVLRRRKEFVKVAGGGSRPKVITAFDDVLREIAVMKKLKQANVVRLYEVIDDERNDLLFMIMELMSGGQVATWNSQTKRYDAHPSLRKPSSLENDDCNPVFAETSAQRVLRDVVSGLDYLHRQGVVHRDIKPENLLLSASGRTTKICDFGVSHVSEVVGGEANNTDPASPGSPGVKLRNTKGTYAFQAPEALTGEEFDGFAADIWAVGVCAHCFLFGELPFFAESAPDLLETIGKAATVTLPGDENVSEVAKAFVSCLLERDVVCRPRTTAEVKALPFLERLFYHRHGGLSRGGSEKSHFSHLSRAMSERSHFSRAASVRSALNAQGMQEVSPPLPSSPLPPAEGELGREADLAVSQGQENAPPPGGHQQGQEVQNGQQQPLERQEGDERQEEEDADEQDVPEDDPGEMVSVNRQDIRLALTRTKLDLAALALIKLRVQAWRRRARERLVIAKRTSSTGVASSAMTPVPQRREEEDGVRASGSFTSFGTAQGSVAESSSLTSPPRAGHSLGTLTSSASVARPPDVVEDPPRGSRPAPPPPPPAVCCVIC